MNDIKYCKDCKNMNCPEGRVNCKYPDAVACALYRDTQPTIFETITASPEVLAESSVYFEEEHTLVLEGSEHGVTFPGGWTSPFIEYTYATKPEAIAATVVRLKEVNDVDKEGVEK